MRKLSGIGLILIVASMIVYGATSYTSETVDPSKIGVGADVLGKGGTGVAVEGINPLLNPAGIAGGENALKIRTMYTNLLNGDISYITIGGAVPTPIGIYGLTFMSGNSSGISLYDSSGTATGETSYSNSTLVLTTGFRLIDMSWLDWFPVWMNRNDLSLGMNLKFFGQSAGVSGFQANGQDLDLGAIYKVNNIVSLGLNFKNVLPQSLGGNMHWQNNTNYGIPGETKLGAAFTINDKFKLLSEVDVRAGMTPFHFGGEFQPNEYFTLRAGLDQSIKPNESIATDITLGLGLNIKGFEVDYAYHPYSIESQNNYHYFTFSYTGGKYHRSKRVYRPSVLEQKKYSETAPVKVNKVVEEEAVAVGGYYEASRDDIHVIQPATSVKVYEDKLNVRVLVKGDIDDLAINGRQVNAVKGGIVGSVVNLNYGKETIAITYKKDGKKYRTIKEALYLPSFTDINEGRWSKDVVEYMAALGIYLGNDMPKAYDGKASISVRDMAEIIAKYIRVKRGAVVDIDRATYDIIGLAKDLGYPGGLNARTMVNRGLACAVVVKLGGVPTMKVAKSPFIDVLPGSWYADSVLAAKNAGWISGINVKGQFYFMPGDEINRETFVNLLRPLVSEEINKLKI